MISTAATIISYFDQSLGLVIEKHYDEFVELGRELWALSEARAIGLPESIVADSIEAQKMMPFESTTSMHRDFERKKRTELEILTGYPLREGLRLGVKMPLYEKMYRFLSFR